MTECVDFHRRRALAATPEPCQTDAHPLTSLKGRARGRLKIKFKTEKIVRSLNLELARHAEAMNLLLGIVLVITILGTLVALGSYLMISFLSLA